jgi:UrcA family protein
MIQAQEHEKSDTRVRRPRRGDLRLSWVVLHCLLVGIASTESHAAQPGLGRTEVRVRYKQWELTSPTAMHALFRRIGDAALEACGASSFSLAEVQTATKLSPCWRDAVDDAVRRVGSPALSAVASEGRRWRAAWRVTHE